MAEQQILRVMDCLKLMQPKGKARIELQADAQMQYNKKVQGQYGDYRFSGSV